VFLHNLENWRVILEGRGSIVDLPLLWGLPSSVQRSVLMSTVSLTGTVNRPVPCLRFLEDEAPMEGSNQRRVISDV